MSEAAELAHEVVNAEPEVQSDLDILNSEDEPAAEPAATDEPAAEEPAPAATDEPPAEEEEEAPAEEKPEEKKAETEKKEEEKPTEPPIPATVKAMKDAIEQNPALKAAVDADPKFRNMIYANARRSQELSTFKEQFATLELAKAARQSAEEFADIESAFSTMKPEGFDNLIERMGQFGDDAVINFFTHHRTAHFWPTLTQIAQQQDRDDILEAAEMLQDFLGDKQGQSPRAEKKTAAPAKDDESRLTPEERKLLEKARSLESQQGKADVQAREQYERGVATSVESDVKAMLKARIEKYAPALNPEQVAKVLDDTWKDVNGIAAKDRLYQTNWSGQLRKANNSDDVKKALVSSAINYARNVAGPIIQKHTRIFGTAAVQAAQAKQQKLETQQKAANVKGAAGTQTPLRQGDVHSLIREGEKLTQKMFGRSLSNLEILDIEEKLPALQKMAKDRGL